MGPLTFCLHFFIRLYKTFVSPFLGPNCRFTPTCSSYALSALEKFGLAKGCVLIFRRVLKCHPWGGSGHDPLPK